jgi:hypothetical protein
LGFVEIALFFPLRWPDICVPFLKGICIVQAESRSLLKTNGSQILVFKSWNSQRGVLGESLVTL